ncbi:MAG: Restriction endonuclease subunit R [Actinobacteria bacterium]|nr:Restriction endonuclease subunit R [Actinomycetota bacterium]
MSDLESLRKRIAEEEARLARIEKERDEALAKLQELKDRLAVEDSAPIPPKPVPSEWLTSSERIRAASEIPFEEDLVEKKPIPTGAKGPRRE